MKKTILVVSLGLALLPGSAWSDKDKKPKKVKKVKKAAADEAETPDDAPEGEAAPKVDAKLVKKLVSEAEKELDENCNMNECPAFPGAAKKLSKAFKMDPDSKISWIYCNSSWPARSSGSLTPKLWEEAVFMCDATLMTHKEQDIRTAAVSRGEDLRSWAYHAKADDKNRPRLSDPAAAARALFGDGFKVTVEGDKPSLSWSPAVHNKMQKYIRDYYIYSVLKNRFDNQTLVRADEKLTMCMDIVGLIEDQKTAKEVARFCEWHAARESNQEMFTFRGPEPYKVGESGKLFQLQMLPDNTVIYEPLLSIAGPKVLDDYESVMAQNKMVGKILDKEDHPFYRDAAKVKLRLDKLIKAKKKEVEKVKEKRASKGPKIYFYDRLGQEWDIPEPVTKHVADCSKLIVEAVNNDYSDLTTEVDGETCTFDKTWAMLKDHCKDALLPGERHKVTAELRRVKYKKTGKQRARITDDSVEMEDIYSSKTGKVVAKASITCGE